LDDTDEENGCMQVLPGSHRWDTLCVARADTASSFTDQTVPLPPDAKPVACVMKAGDVLFFNGQLVHGSFPNVSKDRFRRSLIAHYVDGHAERVTPYCKPVLRMDGTEVILEDAPGGGACGRWVDVDGKPVIEMTGQQGAALEAIH
jgi:ectoine hydroxylase-related dioxygenase (phytanoyl-CoA dioxygenase family)